MQPENIAAAVDILIRIVVMDTIKAFVLAAVLAPALYLTLRALKEDR